MFKHGWTNLIFQFRSLTNINVMEIFCISSSFFFFACSRFGFLLTDSAATVYSVVCFHYSYSRDNCDFFSYWSVIFDEENSEGSQYEEELLAELRLEVHCFTNALEIAVHCEVFWFPLHHLTSPLRNILRIKAMNRCLTIWLDFCKSLLISRK